MDITPKNSDNFIKVRNFIKSNDVHQVAIALVSIGMNENCNNENLNLVRLCLQSKDEWIRRAGYICLYHFYIRFRDSVCSNEVIELWRKGMTDKNSTVNSILNDTIDEIKEFSPSIYKQLVSNK